MGNKLSTTRKWVFIVGCYNSGTTLLETLLRQHPEIAGLPDEGQFLTDFVTPLSVGLPRLWAQNEDLFRFPPESHPELAKQAMADWSAKLDRPQAPIALEISPTNTARTRWLQQHFPNTFFIYILRNGFAVALGIRDKVAEKAGARPRLLEMAAHQWSRSAEVFLEDAPELEHVLEIHYEDLVEMPHQVISRILQCLGVHPLPPEVFERRYRIHGVTSAIMNQNQHRLVQMTREEYDCIRAEAKSILEYHGYDQPWEAFVGGPHRNGSMPKSVAP